MTSILAYTGLQVAIAPMARPFPWHSPVCVIPTLKGDIGRAKRQRQVIAAVMKKAASASTLTNPSKALNVASTTLKALKVDNKTDTATYAFHGTSF